MAKLDSGPLKFSCAAILFLLQKSDMGVRKKQDACWGLNLLSVWTSSNNFSWEYTNSTLDFYLCILTLCRTLRFLKIYCMLNWQLQKNNPTIALFPNTHVTFFRFINTNPRYFFWKRDPSMTVKRPRPYKIWRWWTGS